MGLGEVTVCFVIDRESREIIHLVASVCPSVCHALLLLDVCLCVSNQWAYADNCAEAVDRRFNFKLVLLIVLIGLDRLIDNPCHIYSV